MALAFPLSVFPPRCEFSLGLRLFDAILRVEDGVSTAHFYLDRAISPGDILDNRHIPAYTRRDKFPFVASCAIFGRLADLTVRENYYRAARDGIAQIVPIISFHRNVRENLLSDI